MKKFVAIFAVVALLAVAAPVFAATNPFMDVPMNHWAYDAVASLAAKGILSGYPDGLYKGKQSMTRYEVASALARALSYLDMTTASKQDVEMLKKLVVEFKDELDALGVRVDALEEGFGKMNARLGGWELSGRLRLDVDFNKSEGPLGTFGLADNFGDGDSMGAVNGGYRLVVKKYFGEDEGMLFHAQIDGQQLAFSKFYVEMPFFGESRLLAGRQGWDLDKRFTYESAGAGRYDTGSWFTDTEQAMLAISKNFSLGTFRMYVAHPSFSYGADIEDFDPLLLPVVPAGAWEIAADFGLKFHEKFGFNLGAQYLMDDDWDAVNVGGVALYGKDIVSSVFTGWAGFDVDFMQGFALHGTVYFQSVGVGEVLDALLPDLELGGTAYRLALDVKQDVLKFTSFWAEYAKIPEGFYMHKGVGRLMITDSDTIAGVIGANRVIDNLTLIRLAANQQWNDKWSTWIQWAKLSGDEIWEDSLTNLALGVEYAYNANTTFGLNYISVSGTDRNDDDVSDSRIRFTTQVVF